MKIFLVAFLCLFFALNVIAQSQQNEENSEVSVETIMLARDDGNGKAGEETSVFLTSDVPIYCSVQLNSMKPTTVKLNLIAVNVQSVKPESKVITISYKTNGKQSRVNFTGTPEGLWTVGKYRVDIFVEGKLGGSREFEVQKSSSQKSEDTLPPTKSKFTSKPKLANKIRKN